MSVGFSLERFGRVVQSLSRSWRLPDHPHVPGLGRHWWSDFFELVAHPNREAVIRPPQLVEPLRRVPRRPYVGQGLVQASRFAIAQGLFSLGGAMRLAGRDILLDSLAAGRLGIDSPLYLPALAGLVELGRWDVFIEGLLRLPADRQQDRRAMATLLATIAPLDFQESNPRLAEPLPRDPAFVDYVSGRRVAVVGPASSTAGQGPRIDRYDLVARFNYKEEGVGLDLSHKGGRCDLVYFNRAQTEHLVARGDLSKFPRGPAWVMTRRQEHMDTLRRALEVEGGRCAGGEWRHHYRVTPVYEVPLLRGYLNAAPNAVLDLLHADAAAVDVFHVDFMLSVGRPRDYSPLVQDRVDATRSVLKCFAGVHDPIAQFSLMKAAWQCGRIGGDEPFLAALQLGEQDYMDSLQRLYGDPILAIDPA